MSLQCAGKRHAGRNTRECGSKYYTAFYSGQFLSNMDIFSQRGVVPDPSAVSSVNHEANVSPHPHMIYFNSVEGVTRKDEADSTETASEEVLHWADRLWLFGHFDFPL